MQQKPVMQVGWHGFNLEQGRTYKKWDNLSFLPGSNITESPANVEGLGQSQSEGPL